jgi:DNA-binding HxlR family transcriptional regulator
LRGTGGDELALALQPAPSDADRGKPPHPLLRSPSAVTSRAVSRSVGAAFVKDDQLPHRRPETNTQVKTCANQRRFPGRSVILKGGRKNLSNREAVRISHVPPPKRHPYDQWSPDARALDLVGDKWTLLIVRDLAAGPRRFVELQRVLPGISTEQLRSRLNRMVADGMLTRKRYREVPPRVDYELTERAQELMPILGELARWGYQWAWGTPRPSESIDIGAIFRLAPGLLNGTPGARGTIELTVVDGRDGAPAQYSVTLSSEHATVSERPADRPDATVSGTIAGWVQAFSPAGDRSALRTTGSRELASALLDELALSSGREIGQQAATA